MGDPNLIWVELAIITHSEFRVRVKKMGVRVILTLYFAIVILFTTPWLKKPTLSPSNVFNDSTRRDQLQRSPPVNTLITTTLDQLWHSIWQQTLLTPLTIIVCDHLWRSTPMIISSSDYCQQATLTTSFGALLWQRSPSVTNSNDHLWKPMFVTDLDDHLLWQIAIANFEGNHL